MKIILADLKTLLLLTFLSLLILLFDVNGWLRLPKSLLQSLTVPIQYGLYNSGLSVKRQFAFLYLARLSGQQNLALRKQLSQLISENADLKQKLADNEIMVNQQNYLNPKTYDLLPAWPVSLGRFMVIDKGLDDGLKIGQAVVIQNNYIGQINQVSPKEASVLLVVDPDSKIAVYSQNVNGRARGILSGQFGSAMLMDKILHQENIEIGNLVYSEGTEGLLPRGLILGKVQQVLERQNEVFKQAKVEPIFNMEDLEVVFIVRST